MKPRLMIVARDPYPLFRADVTELFGRWLSQRYDIAWVLRGDDAGRESTVDGFTVGRGLKGWLAVQLCMALHVARGGADLVQVRDAALSSLLFLVVARIARRPFVYWMSFPITDDYRRRALSQPPGRPWLRLARLSYAVAAGAVLHRIVLPRADHVFVQSERMKANLTKKRICAARMTAVPMGVSLSAYEDRLSTDDQRLSGRRVLLYVGAQGPERPLEIAVEALARVAERFDVVLVLMGDSAPEDRARLRRRAEAAGVLERLIFVEHRPLRETLAYVRRADVCLSPFPAAATYQSATPTKLVEYLAMGRPVVASEHPDQRQVIEVSGAGLLAPLTADGFAKAILTLLSDPATAEAMGARGPSWVAAHRDYSVLSEEVDALYRQLLSGAR